jgi:DNA-directed RNA polymerase I subunit RPA1
MKMMGKRVNYAARSVISADPNLETNEVGVPLFIAKKLDFPEPVNEHNVAKLRELVARGSNYPGANFIMDGGKKI